MDIMTHAKFHFDRLMLSLIFGVRASERPSPPPPPWAWQTTEKAGPDKINDLSSGVRNRSDTVTSKICSLRSSKNMGAQRVVYQSGTPGFTPIKIF